MHRHLVPGVSDRVRSAAPIVRLAALAVACCLAAGSRPAAADVVLFQTGFEASEGFVAGQKLDGQGGFVALFGYNPDAATVVTENPATGSQAVRIDGAALTTLSAGGRYIGAYSQPLNYHPLDQGFSIIEVSADILLVLRNDIVPEIEAGILGTDSQGLLLGGPELGGPDAPTGIYGYYHVRAEFNFTSQTYSTYYDGDYDTTYAFVSSSDVINPALFAYGVDAPPSGFDAYFDNFRVTAIAVPEPSSVTLITTGLGVMGFIARGRSRKGGKERVAC